MDAKTGIDEGSAAAPKKLQKSYFDVLGLCCSSEIPLIESILKQLDGVKDVSVIVASRTVIVVHDNLLISQIQIVNALNHARLEANVKMRGETDRKKQWPSPYAIASGVLLVLSFMKYVYRPMGWLALGAVAVGIFPIALRAIAALRNFRLDINVLAIIAVSGTIGMHDYMEAGTIVFLFSIAEWLQSLASHKATAAMSSLMNIAPQRATIAETGEEVDVNEVKLNTILAVKAGDVIPIDGIVVDGKSEVDEKTLTGESFPVTKEKDSSVWAGTISLNGYISVKTTALSEDCVVAKMAELVEEAQDKRSKTQMFIDKFAQYYTPAVVVASICFLIIPIALGVRNRDHWFHLALVVLVSGCPCALVLSTPVATFCALTKAARSGLLIKGGDYLETLAKIKTVALDKTGTITRGEFAVAEFKSLSNEISRETLLYWVSSIESKSSHPLAAAVVQYGRSSGVVPKPDDVEEFENFPGEGIYGRIDGKDFFIGSKKIATRADSQIVLRSENDVDTEGKTAAYIFLGAELVGVFSLSDKCRTGVVEAIKELKLWNIQSVMLTGDSIAAAMDAQNQLGNVLDRVYAELLPEGKSKIIEQLKKNGPTAMVGDGINDAPALATSDIGISMGISGSALATETGHVILMSNDIRMIPKAIKLARRAKRKVIENVFLSFFTRVAILALAFSGHPLVWAAVLSDTGTCLLVIMNSMLLLRGGHRHEHAHKCCRKSAHAPKKDECVGNDKNQDRDQCCSKKNCNSSALLQAQTHQHPCGTRTTQKNCCESTICTPKKNCRAWNVSCESRNHNSAKRCHKRCHSNRLNASSDEIVEIQNFDEKECCSSSRASPDGSQCQSGATKIGSEIPNLRCKQGCCPRSGAIAGRTATDSKSPEANLDHTASCCKGDGAERCCTGSCDSVKAKSTTCCAANDLEEQLHTHGQNRRDGEKMDECRLHNCELSSVRDCNLALELPPDGVEIAAAAHACCSSENREIGGYCESYRKACRAKERSEHLGHHGFGGCLTEVIVE
ncbi:hypothetical protein SAY86_002031 [Trapa natans]|uniref:HMA domain-containing protein n=1 Tax=Trapa natans TaxID=22666 RepID=A0AAN7R010_TRANT|nr:hypothetical protein SAY86_002031 [Trapa natans]